MVGTCPCQGLLQQVESLFSMIPMLTTYKLFLEFYVEYPSVMNAEKVVMPLQTHS